MKLFSPIVFALIALVLVSATPSQAQPPVQFRGVCQQCGGDLLAYWQPVACLGGGYESRWVPVCHDHCRPACLGPKKRDFFNSHLMNPANPRRNQKKLCTDGRVQCRKAGTRCQ